MGFKFCVLALFTLGAIRAKGNADVPFSWRLVDEASCLVETMNPVQSAATLHLTIQKLGGASEIRVQDAEQEQPLEDWLNPGPKDSRSIAVTPTRRVQIKVTVSKGERSGPQFQVASRDTSVLTCGKTRLRIRTLRSS
jgi:hypothetical protein